MAIKIIRVLITGRVQGVWYRGWTIQEVQKANLDGWVRTIQMVVSKPFFAGFEKAIDTMIEACFQGPPAANVVNVVGELFEGPVMPGFRQLPTVH